MISQEKASLLIKKYEKDLNQFQSMINKSNQHLLRCDFQIIPNVLTALKAIESNLEFEPQVANSGMSSIRVLSTNPQEALKELLVKEDFHNHFKKMCTHYAGHKPNLLTNLTNFHATICRELTPVLSKPGFFEDTLKRSEKAAPTKTEDAHLGSSNRV